MTVGNARYQCSCVRYVSKDNIPLIVGVSIGVGLLLIIIIIVIIIASVLCRRRRRKRSEHRQVAEDHEDMSMGDYITPSQYSRQLS